MKMRNVIVMLLLALFAILPVMAEDPSGFYSGPYAADSMKAGTKVVLDLSGSGDDQTSLVELYFTGSSDAPTKEASAPSAKATVDLDFGSTVNVADNSKDTVYAWWRILYGGNLDVQLGIEAPLKQETVASQQDSEAPMTEPFINWSASWADEAATLAEGDDKTVTSKTTNDYETLDQHTGSEATMSMGHAKLTIATDPETDFESIPAGSYSSVLYLKCVTRT